MTKYPFTQIQFEPTEKMGTSAKKNIQSILLEMKDYSQLLDMIDVLRSQGVHHYVSVPQIIVCGDQSSGKSSVLNAVSGFGLPAKDGLCTRFAIELILRYSPDNRISVAIIPGPDRTTDDKARFAQFQFQSADIDDLPKVVEKAKETMGVGPEGRALSDDVLRIEYSGPNQTNLTLVDLPGVIHSENKQQSAEDVRLVSKLVKAYMENRRSIILAVVSAKNDFATQIITKLAHEVDPKGQRTLGIITKPDTLPVGSESEKLFLELAKNEQVQFRLGWHVLKNRDWNEQDSSTEARDESEQLFFSQGVWTLLANDCLGAASLKTRLSAVLRDQIISELPSFIQDVEDGIDDCEDRLSKLGESRSTQNEQRQYLISLSRSFERLVKEAVDGNYNDAFFGDAKTRAGFSKRLRAVLQDCLTTFKEEILRDGQAQTIVENGKLQENDPKQILREDYLKGVGELLKRTRGRELPGLYNPMVVSDLFYEQSKPWGKMVDTFQGKILEAVSFCIDSVLNYIADNTTSDGLDRYIIAPARESYIKKLRLKVDEIMKPNRRGHPITYDRSFIDSISARRQERMKANMRVQLTSFFRLSSDVSDSESLKVTLGGLLDALGQISETDMNLYACSDATDAMQAYYEVALKRLIDNFGVLAAEFCVVEQLWAIFTPEIVNQLTNEEVAEIAAETEESQIERYSATAKLNSLQEGLKTLRTLNRHKAQAFSFEIEFNDTPSIISTEGDISTFSEETEEELPEKKLPKSAKSDDEASMEIQEKPSVDFIKNPLRHPEPADISFPNEEDWSYLQNRKKKPGKLKRPAIFEDDGPAT